MSAVIVFAVFLLICTILKFLNVTSPPRAPRLMGSDAKFLELVLKYCPHLNETYVPVRLWGSSGHLQTIVHATVGRTYCPHVVPRRIAARQEDGATVTWDIYEPTGAPVTDEDYTIAVCPGIANSSESTYVRSLVSLACSQGYRCVVLNHLGVLPHVKVTSPRVFRYGQSDELHLMLTKYVESRPDTKLILVGFSMGGNIVCKYLGEPNRTRPTNIMGAISICQGYDAVKSLQFLLEWNNLARLYLFSMTENMRSVILRHKEALLTEEVKRRYNIDERRVLSAATLPELDEVYTRRIFGFRSVEELYRNDSSAHYLNNISVPVVFINARDDPLVHPDMLYFPQKFVQTHKNSLYIETDHGGHLGYYDGGYILPRAVTWLDRTVLSLVSALANNSQ
ncbi:abhydrolase domain-containing protein 2-like [Eriocheir sinensis]|uniref:abhydrolase domain-containing protein 2-like n=1 Tax=Eriocheir sinensis TaxID=95602 RepID=UPI0021C8201C|nr:abhydrolase domain-containing protein 2-like [Eriocheir sinensis]